VPEPSDPFATRATTLLLELAEGSESAAREYDSHLYGFLVGVAIDRGVHMARDFAESKGAAVAGFVQVRKDELEEVARDAVLVALRRAKGAALRFDAERGDGASWALGALGPAFLEELRRRRGARRALLEVPSEDSELEPTWSTTHSDPEQHAEVRDALDRALGALDEDERFVILAKLHYGLTYREIAAARFGDASKTKDVDHVLQRSRAKLRAANEEWLRGE
jgi:RNA polymerase sigma factor (sigma-70 family)